MSRRSGPGVGLSVSRSHQQRHKCDEAIRQIRDLWNGQEFRR